MTWLPDAAVERLREVAEWPDFDGTRYEILERVGSGGMGSVYRARDRELDREVALKVLSLPDPESAARMLREARVIARLEHPGIVPIHDVGRLPDGRVFYAMKLVIGQRLDQLVARGEPLAVRLRAFERICEAVAFAQARGVIHRDLKPENVMVGPFGEVLVMDWGLARGAGGAAEGAMPLSGERVGATSHGAILGTPGYMAPEQARGDISSLDERTDVYGLGALLHFLLVGAPPPATATIPPGRLRSDVPVALEAVCRKALAAEPEARYVTAGELAGDIARFLAGDAVGAYPEGILRRARRLARKHRAAIVLIAAYLLMRLLLLRF
jgi:serine/threonine protein kinase